MTSTIVALAAAATRALHTRAAKPQPRLLYAAVTRSVLSQLPLTIVSACAGRHDSARTKSVWSRNSALQIAHSACTNPRQVAAKSSSTLTMRSEVSGCAAQVQRCGIAPQRRTPKETAQHRTFGGTLVCVLPGYSRWVLYVVTIGGSTQCHRVGRVGEQHSAVVGARGKDGRLRRRERDAVHRRAVTRLDSMQHATCNMQHATCNMHRSTPARGGSYH